MVRRRSVRIFYVLAIFLKLFFLTQARDVGTCPPGSNTVGQNCHSQGESWQYDGVCVLVRNSKRCYVPDTRTFQFNLRVSIRLGPLAQSKAIKDIYVGGAGPGLDWAKPVKLQKTASGVGIWTVQLQYTYDSKATLCENPEYCTFNQRGLELRVYRDAAGTEDMVGPNLYVNLPTPGSMSGHNFFTTPDIDVLPWFEGKAMAVEGFEVFVSQLGTVKVTLFYPPSYDYNIRKKYPVMILFGANVAIQVGPLLEFMYVQEASIDEVIVVVIHHSEAAPFCDFSPYSEGSNGENANLIWRCKREEDCRTCHRCWDPEEQKCTRELFLSTANECLFPTKCSKNPLGEVWLDAIEKDIIPRVDIESKRRTLTNFPISRLTMIGFDGLGLLACHAAITRSHVYQNVACFSPPLHWPVKSLTEMPKADKTGIGLAMKTFSHNFMFYPEMFAFHTTQKYYLDYGEHDNEHFPFVDHEYYMDEFIKQLHEMYEVPTENVLLFKKLPHASNDYNQYPDGGAEVLNRLKLPLLFFFGAEGNPNINFFPLDELSQEEIPDDENETKIPDECLLELQLAYRREELKDPSVPIYMLIIAISKISVVRAFRM